MTLTHAETGALIARLGQAIEDGRVTWEAAIAELTAAPTPTGLSRQGALLQLRSWRSAELRHQHLDHRHDDRAQTEPVDARSFKARPPIVLRFRPPPDTASA